MVMRRRLHVAAAGMGLFCTLTAGSVLAQEAAPAQATAPVAPSTPVAPATPVLPPPSDTAAPPVAPASPAPSPLTAIPPTLAIPTEPTVARDPTVLAPTKAAEPFAFGDFTWLNGANRQHKAVLDSEYFTGSFLLDVNYTASKANPIDNTVVGSTALSRNNEVTVAFIGFGGDFHDGHARGRLMTQFGVRSTLVPRNDGSTYRGQFDLQTALRYLSEAYGGYHWDALNGINLDAGIFMSYIGLFSYDNFENWMYLPSFTSDNTPWFFNGLRLQVFTSDKFKIEPWVINGWQSYGKFNEMPGFGMQILWRPTDRVSLLSNDYVGWDTQDNPGRIRFHSDNSFLLNYYRQPLANQRHGLLGGLIPTKMAFSVTADAGGEQGDGVTPFGGHSSPNPASCTTSSPCTQNFLSAMAYNRIWFGEHFAWTTGGGVMSNPGRYLVLAPSGIASPLPQPYNEVAGGGPESFPLSPGTKFQAYDYESGVQYMPDEHQTWDLEINHRQSSVNYFAGHGGVTSPDGYNTTAVPPGWRPDLQKGDTRIIMAFLLRF
jgi:hypothetical protein